MNKVLIALTLCLAMTLTACSTSWVSTMDTILAEGAPAVVDILEIAAAANGKAVDANLVAKISTDAADIKSAATAFANASASAAPSTCAQLQAALGVFQADEQLILQVAQVTDPATQAKIGLLADLVAGTITAITAIVPSCQAPASSAFKATAPAKLTNFVSDYNTILKAKTGNAAVDKLTPKLTLHQHSKVMRVLTAGMLK